MEQEAQFNNPSSDMAAADDDKKGGFPPSNPKKKKPEEKAKVKEKDVMEDVETFTDNIQKVFFKELDKVI